MSLDSKIYNSAKRRSFSESARLAFGEVFVMPTAKVLCFVGATHFIAKLADLPLSHQKPEDYASIYAGSALVWAALTLDQYIVNRKKILYDYDFIGPKRPHAYELIAQINDSSDTNAFPEQTVKEIYSRCTDEAFQKLTD